MNFDVMPPEEKKHFVELLFAPLSSAEEVRDWIQLFLGLEIPFESVEPESNSSPLDAIWQIYNTFKTNSGDVSPGYILLSARESMKTVSVAILEVMLLIHFEIDIAHAAAIEAQSSVGLQYIEDFFLKIQPLMAAAGWTNLTQNKRTYKFKAPSGKTPFIKIIVCTAKGMNSLHANAIFLDELDLADPVAIKEGINIVGYSKGIYGVAVYLSTRKYAFGNMAKILDQAEDRNYKVLRWNILDVTERCPTSRHKPELPREDRYVAKSLPLKQMSTEEFVLLSDVEQSKMDLVKQAYHGCTTCKLLPVCRMRLSTKTEKARGGFYKPIVSVNQKFLDNDPDTAEAQLLCWKPGSEGLVYPRFKSGIDAGNVISLKKAFEDLLGVAPARCNEAYLLTLLKTLNIPMYCGVDWGFTHDTVLIVFAKFDNGDVWVIDCFSSPGLEFSDVLAKAMTFRDKYNIQKWFCDQAYPANIKTFNKNGMKSPKFTKDVPGGIESIRSKIVNASGNRFLKILYTDNNKKVITAFSQHRFVLDGQGNITSTPDDNRGIADICDAARYVGQNLFPVKGTQKPGMVMTEEEAKKPATIVAEEQMKQEIMSRVSEGELTGGTGRKGGVCWSF